MKLILTPRLRYDSTWLDSGAVTGSWLPSGDLGAQIQFMLKCGGEHDEEVAFYQLPPCRDSAARGVVALSQTERSVDGGVLAVKLHQAVAGCWITLHSRFDPPCPAEWLAGELPGGDGVVSVWLPRVGLVVLEPSDRLQLIDLLSPPPRSAADVDSWTSPPEVPPQPERLAGSQLPAPMTVDDVLGPSGLAAEADDIGRDAGQLWDQASPQDGLGVAHKLTSWLLSRLDRLSSGKQSEAGKSPGLSEQSAGSAGGRTAGADAAAGNPIATALFRYLARSVAEERDKQLNKLLQMARVDPDRALQFAIPLAGWAALGGLAIPGAKLLSRLPNFSLSGIGGGGGPADVWEMDEVMRNELVAAYHAMANRESAAGRYRRAAYIYASLLGNLTAAAEVLVQGGYFQEAEVLYREKLGRPADAARCLMLAGWFEQAADAFAKLSDHVQESEAWRRAGDSLRAHEALQRAVASLIQRHNILAAADLIRDRLHDRERAIELLFDQWPGGRACAAKAFTWWGEAGEHAIAKQKLQTAIDRTTDDHRLALVELTHNLAKQYPDRELQRFAEDQCRVAISQIAALDAKSDSLPQALQFLKTLDADDPLLGADASRYVERIQREQLRIASPPRSRGSDKIIKRLPVLLPLPGSLRAAAMVQGDLFTLRQERSAIWATRFLDAGDVTKTTPDMDQRRFDELEQSFHQGSPVELLVRGNQIHLRGRDSQNAVEPDRLPCRRLGEDWLIHWRWPKSLESSDAVTAGSDGCFASVETQAGETMLTQWSAGGLAMRTHSLTVLLDSIGNLIRDEDESDRDAQELIFSFNVAPELPTRFTPPTRATTHVAYLDDRIIVAAGSTLIVQPETSDTLTESVDHPITAIAVSPRHTRRRIAVAHHDGLNVYWWEMNNLHCQRILSGQSVEHVLWMRGGRLFAISEGQLFRYQVTRQTSLRSGQITLQSRHPIALLALSASVCGVVDRSGLIERF